jgi:hypothetical protein
MWGEHMKTVKVVFTGSEATYEVVCQSCGRKKSLRHEQLRHLRHAVKVKCGCGVIFNVVFERRRFYRKKVQLDAQLFDVDSGKKLDDVTLVTISVGGVGFVSHLNDITVGDKFRVRFSLDNDAQTLVDEEIRVRNILKEVIGAEFVQQDYYNFDLDFYLMPIAVVD